MIIREIKKEELPECLDLIHRSFKTVADKFGFTKENCPGHNSFMPMEKLENFWNWGFKMYGLFEELGEGGCNEICGYFSLSRIPERENVIGLHNLCVMPEKRRKGYGNLLLDFAKDQARAMGGKIFFLDFIDEHTELKNWYLKNGFRFLGTEKYKQLPFTVGKAEMIL